MVHLAPFIAILFCPKQVSTALYGENGSMLEPAADEAWAKLIAAVKRNSKKEKRMQTTPLGEQESDSKQESCFSTAGGKFM
jgi:hypothetical protein